MKSGTASDIVENYCVYTVVVDLEAFRAWRFEGTLEGLLPCAPVLAAAAFPASTLLRTTVWSLELHGTVDIISAGAVASPLVKVMIYYLYCQTRISRDRAFIRDLEENSLSSNLCPAGFPSKRSYYTTANTSGMASATKTPLRLSI